jgi:23S rRNA pseudouridine955/2504/2580 synthase
MFPDLSLSAVYAALRRGEIVINGRKARPEYRIIMDDAVSFDPSLIEALRESPSSSDSRGLQDLADVLVLATQDLLFLNKPRGLLVHGPDSLEERVRSALADRSEASLSFIPGPLHRLDRNTSGLIVFPRSAEGARAFTSLLKAHGIRKSYIALLEGRLSGGEEWTDDLVRDGSRRISFAASAAPPSQARVLRRALSSVRPLLEAGDHCLALVEIHTGLTHQIRAQASARGLPLAGDLKYGGHAMPGGYVLHAFTLEFPIPPFADLPQKVSAALPASARLHLEELFGSSALDSALKSALGA